MSGLVSKSEMTEEDIDCILAEIEKIFGMEV